MSSFFNRNQTVANVNEFLFYSDKQKCNNYGTGIAMGNAVKTMTSNSLLLLF